MKQHLRWIAVVADPVVLAIPGANRPLECGMTIMAVTGSRGGR